MKRRWFGTVIMAAAMLSACTHGASAQPASISSPACQPYMGIGRPLEVNPLIVAANQAAQAERSMDFSVIDPVKAVERVAHVPLETVGTMTAGSDLPPPDLPIYFMFGCRNHGRWVQVTEYDQQLQPPPDGIAIGVAQGWIVIEANLPLSALGSMARLFIVQSGSPR